MRIGECHISCQGACTPVSGVSVSVIPPSLTHKSLRLTVDTVSHCLTLSSGLVATPIFSVWAGEGNIGGNQEELRLTIFDKSLLIRLISILITSRYS